ncbi:hypothetical protein C8R45DRAFT_89586 [Mycena sanguinolenta]|nr:hypothetical protein C8R45DRAFT_89586 [Mycena sanguinolenta]
MSFSMDTTLAQRTERAGRSSRAASIHTLLVELLAEIFVLTIRASDTNELVQVFEHSLHVQDAFRISHVCRRWRDIANGTPQLWAGSIDLDLRRRSDPKKKEIYVNGLRAWFTRSEPLSLPIYIKAPPDRSSWIELSSRLTEELLRIAPRLRSLRSIHVVPGSLIQPLAGSTLCSLEELELRNVVDDGMAFDPAIILSFATAPRLRKLTIDWTTRITMPWAQLTDITFTNQISPEVFLEIFSQCINVAKASILTPGWSSFAPPRVEVIALDHLRILSITWVEDEPEHQDHYLRLLDCFSAPALAELSLSFCLDVDWEEATFTAFQLRSLNITKLKLEGDCIIMPTDALITALRHAPSLVYLSVDDHFLPDDLLEALCYTENADPLVPSLHILTLGALNEQNSQDYLASMIASRWWTDAELASRATAPAVARWTQIRVRDDSEPIYGGFAPCPQLRDKMEDLRQTGLAVELIESKFWDFAW